MSSGFFGQFFAPASFTVVDAAQDSKTSELGQDVAANAAAIAANSAADSTRDAAIGSNTALATGNQLTIAANTAAIDAAESKAADGDAALASDISVANAAHAALVASTSQDHAAQGARIDSAVAVNATQDDRLGVAESKISAVEGLNAAQSINIANNTEVNNTQSTAINSNLASINALESLAQGIMVRTEAETVLDAVLLPAAAICTHVSNGASKSGHLTTFSFASAQDWTEVKKNDVVKFEVTISGSTRMVYAPVYSYSSTSLTAAVHPNADAPIAAASGVVSLLTCDEAVGVVTIPDSLPHTVGLGTTFSGARIMLRSEISGGGPSAAACRITLYNGSGGQLSIGTIGSGVIVPNAYGVAGNFNGFAQASWNIPTAYAYL